MPIDSGSILSKTMIASSNKDNATNTAGLQQVPIREIQAQIVQTTPPQNTERVDKAIGDSPPRQSIEDLRSYIEQTSMDREDLLQMLHGIIYTN